MAYHDNKTNKKKKAPTINFAYNFIGLNSSVLPAVFACGIDAAADNEEKIAAFKDFLNNDEAKYSGYFSVEAETKTPLYIEGKSGFFSDGSRLLIPGSSLRGCIKNYFKIITNSKMIPYASGNGDINGALAVIEEINEDDKPKYKKAASEKEASDHFDIAAHVPKALQEGIIDFAEAVFGNKECWAGRVFFEDLYLQKNQDKVWDCDKAEDAKILFGPNPCLVKNYLCPKEDRKESEWKLRTDAEKDGLAYIKGYKMYWHNHGVWKNEEKDNRKYDNKEYAPKKIRPVKEGKTFSGRVRFENLSAVELGALVAVFALGKEDKHYFKLGMGKAIGLGSLKLQYTLHVQANDYYCKLFADDGSLYEGEKACDAEKFYKKFDEYRKAKCGESLADDKRIKELKYIMFDYGVDKQGEYRLKDGEKRKTLCLPSISEIVKGRK